MKHKTIGTFTVQIIPEYMFSGQVRINLIGQIYIISGKNNEPINYSEANAQTVFIRNEQNFI